MPAKARISSRRALSWEMSTSWYWMRFPSRMRVTSLCWDLIWGQKAGRGYEQAGGLGLEERNPVQTGSVARSFCPPVLTTGTFEDESGSWGYRMREGPPTMEREVRRKVSGARSPAVGRQCGPG